MYTYKEGKRVDPTHLHVADWLDCIRNGGQPRCNIEEGFEEAVACHMATESYLQGRRVEWDPVKKRIVYKFGGFSFRPCQTLYFEV